MLYVGVDLSKLLNLFIYIFVITLQIFVLCYYGDLYCQAIDYLTESIYDCSWVDRNEKFKKTFLILLKRSQMPTTIMAGNIIPVRMPTFVTVNKKKKFGFVECKCGKCTHTHTRQSHSNERSIELFEIYLKLFKFV